MKLHGWSKMNPTERRAIVAAILCLLCAIACCALVVATGFPLFKRLCGAGLAGMFLSLGISDLRRHTVQAIGEFLIAAGILVFCIAALT